jgi:hypothetical protein
LVCGVEVEKEEQVVELLVGPAVRDLDSLLGRKLLRSRPKMVTTKALKIWKIF